MLHSTIAEDSVEATPEATDRSMRIVEVVMAIAAVVFAGILTFLR
jgi:hypothetical protein